MILIKKFCAAGSFLKDTIFTVYQNFDLYPLKWLKAQAPFSWLVYLHYLFHHLVWVVWSRVYMQQSLLCLVLSQCSGLKLLFSIEKSHCLWQIGVFTTDISVKLQTWVKSWTWSQRLCIKNTQAFVHCKAKQHLQVAQPVKPLLQASPKHNTFQQHWWSIFHLPWQDNRGESQPPYLWTPCQWHWWGSAL